MSNLDDEPFSQLGSKKSAIQSAVTLITRHSSVERLLEVHQDDDTDAVEVVAEIRVNLPSRQRAMGASPNGVLAVEPITFSFPPDYPIHAPVVKLRTDFNRSLAHVQPGAADGPVLPCLYHGDLDELFHAEGLWSILNQVVVWLNKAAAGELIDPNQGWEPIRRDTLEDIIIADGNYLRSLVSRKESHYFLRFSYLKFVRCGAPKDARKEYFIHGQVDTERVRFDPQSFGEIFQEWSYHKTSLMGRSLAIVVTPGKLPSGVLHIADCYHPENVTNLASLQIRATEYGCANSLKSALTWLGQYAKKFNSKLAKVPIAIILCVRRPFSLIAHFSEIELVPYLVDIQAPKLFPEKDDTPVFPAGHRESITPALLQTFSGESPILEPRNVVLVGGGSLGSKIAIHMARLGRAPSSIIDKGFLLPHNAARYALLPGAEAMQLTWLDSKAQALASAIKGLGQSSKAWKEDVTLAAHNSNLLNQLFPKDTWAIINTTASLAVREALASITSNKLQARIIETSLFARGTVGLMTVEGPGRNPNSADLLAEAYESIRVDDELREAVFESEDSIQYYSVGQGCGSITMAISDSRISMFAASVTQGIATMRADGLPDSVGRIFLGKIADAGMGLSWTPINVPPVCIVPTDSDSAWIVRISERAHQKILKDCANYPQVETGGILVGRISETQQAFIVIDVLPAPQDSERSRSGFILGTYGVKDALEKYASSCNYALYCLGSWHSHLTNSGPSSCDLQTAMKIAGGRIARSVLLIRTPTGYRAVAVTSF